MPLEQQGEIKLDAHGSPVDPTANVIALSASDNRRQDDLRSASDKRNDDLRVAHDKFQDERIRHLEDIAVLRAEHSKELRHMEADRVDKIRSVDVANAAATAAQLLSAVNTLATTAQTTAEVLRNQVAATATAVASQTERALNPILDRIALLEKSSYTGAGKGAGISLSWGVIVVVGMALIALASYFNRTPPISAPAPPQVIYAVPPSPTK